MYSQLPNKRIRPAAALRGLLAGCLLATAIGGTANGAGASVKDGTDTTFLLRLAGAGGPNEIDIAYDGAQYVITANGTLAPPAGRSCTNPVDDVMELDCPAADVNGIQVDAGGGNDTVTVGKSVPVPTVLNGGPGLDDLIGGASTDRISGGSGDDKLIGRHGPDQLAGGSGADTLIGGSGKDVLRGGPGIDILRGGPGRDVEKQ